MTNVYYKKKKPVSIYRYKYLDVHGQKQKTRDYGNLEMINISDLNLASSRTIHV